LPSFTLSNLRLPPFGGPCSRIYSRQEHGNPVISLDIGPSRKLKLKSKSDYDRQSVGQFVFVSGALLGPGDQFLFLLEISFRQLRVCYFVAPSLTRGQVCNLLVQLLLGLARAVTLGSKSRRTHGHILLPHLKLPLPGGPGPRIYIPQEQGGPVIPQGTGFHLIIVHLADSVDQFIWVSGLPLGPLTRFYLALLFSSDNYFILLPKASFLTRKRVCSLQCNHSLVPITILCRLI
jgi:hypothetical protein